MNFGQAVRNPKKYQCVIKIFHVCVGIIYAIFFVPIVASDCTAYFTVGYCDKNMKS